MSAHVLFYSLNELNTSDNMRGFPSILSLDRNEFNKARVLDSIYHMTLKFLKNRILCAETSSFYILFHIVIKDVIA